MERQKQPLTDNKDTEEDERDRRATNIFLAVAAVLVVAGGVWLVNAMVDSRKAQLCFESGRRNCNPIAVPARQPD
jgi:hypothetical protein